MSEPKPKFYLTTPIYYVNARPHIGHAYTTIVADVLARRHRLLGEDTFFLTGTDEHGQKIERSAAAAGVAPQQFADEVSASFEALWKRMGITNDAYIRTTDPKHQRGVQKLFAELYEKGFIYLDSYTGQYSIGEEMFVEGPPGTIGPDGKPTETVTEENFFFKLSAFQEKLIDLIESDELKVENDARKNEVLSFLRGNVDTVVTELYDREVGAGAESLQTLGGGIDAQKIALEEGRIRKSVAGNNYVPGALKDLSISRSSFTWGIPVPEPAASDAAQKHVIYVWLDALANYMTAIGYGSDDPKDQAEFAKFWPADLHIIGKEISRFHCVYWPAFLLAADLPLPKAVTAHGWLLFDNSKMSKSKGNIVRTETILDAFGTLCPPSFTGRSSGLQPTESGPTEKGALAPGFSAANNAERDLFASDVLRYFLLREVPFGADGSFSFDSLLARYTADLTNGYGNLVSRTLGLIEQNYPDGIAAPEATMLCLGTHSAAEEFNPGDVKSGLDSEFVSRSTGGFESQFVTTYFKNGSYHVFLAELSLRIGIVDGYISFHKPWLLAKRNDVASRKKLTEILYTAAEAIRIITALLYPVLPFATAKVWLQLGLGDIEVAARNGELKNLQWGGLKPGTKLGPLAPIFPRADKGLIQIMNDMENPTPDARPEAPLKAAATPTPAEPVATDPTHPAAPPRTSAIEDATAGSHVAGSATISTERPSTPSHSEAPASGPFATVASQTPINAGPADASPQITIDDFAKVELRVAEIKVAERIPKADKLLRLEVDLGYERRQILSGIAEWYAPEDLIGRRIVVITNLAPRKMRGLESHGMLLAASNGENGKPVLATFGEEIALGSRLK